MEGKSMVFEKLVQVLADKTDCDASAVTMESTLESLGIDSLDTVEIVMELEEQLEFELELDQKVNTVGELVAIIEAKMAK